MTFRNRKNSILIGMSAIVLSFVLISSSIPQNIFASGEANTLSNQNSGVGGQTPVTKDSDYYVGQWIKIDKEVAPLEKDAGNLEIQIKDLKEGMTVMQQNTKEYADADYKANQLQQQLDQENKKIKPLRDEISNLEALNKKLFEVDPQTKEKLTTDARILWNTYVNKESKTYVGDNPVTYVFADFEHRQMVVMFDPDLKANPDADKIRATILGNMRQLVGNDVPISDQYNKFVPASCTSRNSACVPRIGGIEIARQGQTAQHDTLAYKANDFSGNPGFVIAGHSAYGLNVAITQPTSGSVVGSTTKYCYTSTTDYCDFAFVKANSGITLDYTIYQSSGAVWNISNWIPDSSQTLGTFVKKSGVGSDVTYGTIAGNDPGLNHNLAKVWAVGGDSGSPIFHENSSTSADLYGMIYQHTTDNVYSLYYPQDYIRSTLGIGQ